MKLWRNLSLALLALGCGAATANPLNLPEYSRTLTLEFRSAAEAEQAELTILPLPEDKKVAFSTRWDDSNPKHTRMAETLTANSGWRGTFYLNVCKEQFIEQALPQLTVNGHTVGNHTSNHPDLTNLGPNEIFRQILENRIRLEALTNQPVNAFVLPYCTYKDGAEGRTERWIGEALLRSGEMGSPEYFQELEAEFGMPEHSWAVSYLFGIDDRRPSPESFAKNVEKFLAEREKSPDGTVHLTLGLHTWQDDDGFETLARLFKEYGNNPEWWYCNENEYIAYRYSRFHTRVEKQVDGNKAIFSITGPTPAALGSDVALSVRVDPVPADGEAMIRIPHALPLPQTIDAVTVTDDEFVDSTKIPGISAALKCQPDGTGIVAEVANDAGSTLTDFQITYRLAPALMLSGGRNISRMEMPDLDDPAVAAAELAAVTRRPEPEYQTGPLLLAAECNFILNGQPQRLWISRLVELPETTGAFPRDTALRTGLFEKDAFNEADFLNWSKPEFDPADGWKPAGTAPTFRPEFVSMPRKDGQYVALITEVVAEKDGEAAFRLSGADLKGVYVNGEALVIKPRPTQLRLRPGVNRIVAVYEAKGKARRIAVYADPNANTLLPYVTPGSGQ